MFRSLLMCLLIALATTAPVEDDSQAKIVKYENNIDEKGNYAYSFETSNGILRSESGMIMNEGEPDEHLYVYGELTFTDPDGTIHRIRYQADKNGYEILPPALPGVEFSLPAHVIATMLG